jgi:multidrug efflux system outer membrane protein
MRSPSIWEKLFSNRRVAGVICGFVKNFLSSRRFHAVVLMALSSALLASCQGELARIRQDNAAIVLASYRSRPLAAINNGQSVVALHDCVRLTLENSLDLQTALWDEQVKGKLAKNSRLRMLPKVWGTYYLNQRDRPAFSRSDVIDQEGLFEVTGPAPGTGVTNFSTGRERPSRTTQVQADWSPMDAYMAKFLSEIKSNESAHASYQRVRVAQQLVGTVTAAFYRLLALNMAFPKAKSMEGHRIHVAQDLKALSRDLLVEPQDYMAAEAASAEAKNLVADIALNIEKQKELLAVAMNVSPCDLNVKGYFPQFVCPNPCDLEPVALVNRPEAYQADITHLNAIADYSRLIVKFFPRVEGYIAYFRDENKFNLNKNWTDGGMKVSVDLLDVASNILEREAARDRIVKTDRERAVICIGIISQVKLKALEAIRAIERHKKNAELKNQAAEAYRIALEQQRAKQKGADRQLLLIAAEKSMCTSLQAEIDELLALGDVHAALAELDAAVGNNYPVSAAEMKAVSTGFGPFSRPMSAVKKAAEFLRGMAPY